MRKRLLSFCLVLSLLCSLAVFSPSAAAEPYIGDVNMDGARNSIDVRLLLRGYVNGLSLSQKQQVLADINGDSVCDTADARAIFLMLSEPMTVEIPLSGVDDRTDVNGFCTYTMRAEYTDTYTFTCPNAAIHSVITNKGTTKGSTTVTKDIVAGELVDIVIQAKYANIKAVLTVTPKNNTRRIPYEPQFTVDSSKLDTVGDASQNPLQAATLEYTKREGGSYVYLNNPEKLQPEDIGQAILRDEGLTGNVQVTWEHSNFTGRSIYLGYQLKNEGSSDVFVTVTNIGYQTSGEWLGQQSWSDYYNHKFSLPSDYFNANGKESSRYEGQDFINYTPRVFQPTTYRIPAGKYIYVLGGTSADAYNATNVAGTADKKVASGKCTNAVAKFYVHGGDVTGTFYCYTDASQVKASPKEQGFILDRNGGSFGDQYKGIDYHQGLVEANLTWTVNDSTSSCWLPVKYHPYRDSSAAWKNTPYEAYNSTMQTRNSTQWVTNINPQSAYSGVGSDMMSFECVTTDGKTVTIDTEHADGYGNRANLGNWMVDYQENMTFVNQGDTTRRFIINKNANGALMAMVMDADRNVLAAKCTIRPITASPTAKNYELYTVEVPPHSVKQVTVNFLLMGNSYGSVSNWVELV